MLLNYLIRITKRSIFWVACTIIRQCECCQWDALHDNSLTAAKCVSALITSKWSSADATFSDAFYSHLHWKYSKCKNTEKKVMRNLHLGKNATDRHSFWFKLWLNDIMWKSLMTLSFYTNYLSKFLCTYVLYIVSKSNILWYFINA